MIGYHVVPKLGFVVMILALATSCANRAPGDPFGLARPVEMRAVCLRLADVDGNVYERSAWFAGAAYAHALRFPGARPGLCAAEVPREVPKQEVEPEGRPCASRRCTQTKEN